MSIIYNLFVEHHLNYGLWSQNETMKNFILYDFNCDFLILNYLICGILNCSSLPLGTTQNKLNSLFQNK